MEHKNSMQFYCFFCLDKWKKTKDFSYVFAYLCWNTRYFLYWHSVKKKLFGGVFSWVKQVEKIHNFNFLSQNLSIEYNYLKRDGKFNQEMEFKKKICFILQCKWWSNHFFDPKPYGFKNIRLWKKIDSYFKEKIVPTFKKVQFKEVP